MKIIVNATPLLNLATGIGRYLNSLYRAISLQYPEIEIKYFDGAGVSEKMPSPPKAKSFWAKAVQIAWKMPAAVPYVARRVVHENQARKFLELSKEFDIYHEAGYFPFKTAKNVKTIFTIHDISLKTLPMFHPKDRRLFFNQYFEKSLRFADAIITPSEFTKNEIKKTYPEVNAPIYPVYLGYDRGLFFPRGEPAVDSCKTRFRLPETYILFVGTSDPRKNIKTIIQALAFLPESVKLVCAGWSGWDRPGRAGQNSAAMKNRVIVTGYVTDFELACLYSGARAFVYPSIYEGFGLPVLEAMACGCPVVCSDRASLPEVAGSAALYCDPDDPAQLARAIQKMMDSESLCTEMRFKSLAQAKNFSWDQAAQKTLAVFEDVFHCQKQRNL
ncbi:MAG: glycosyl transferase [Desulfobacterales bacterium CG23_combo_of_CG06-09_8_20_14_all_51_8]|nr:MAG: glycosyl transferase [Desulfobacterales bacterium CG23_combo_of_CG06-09_8_20_14_all_51_8]